MFKLVEKTTYKTKSLVVINRYSVLVNTGAEAEFEVYIDVDKHGRQFDGSFRKDTEIGQKLLKFVCEL